MDAAAPAVALVAENAGRLRDRRPRRGAGRLRGPAAAPKRERLREPGRRGMNARRPPASLPPGVRRTSRAECDSLVEVALKIVRRAGDELDARVLKEERQALARMRQGLPLLVVSVGRRSAARDSARRRTAPPDRTRQARFSSPESTYDLRAQRSPDWRHRHPSAAAQLVHLGAVK